MDEANMEGECALPSHSSSPYGTLHCGAHLVQQRLQRRLLRGLRGDGGDGLAHREQLRRRPQSEGGGEGEGRHRSPVRTGLKQKRRGVVLQVAACTSEGELR
jgi:hypothetical protein